MKNTIIPLILLSLNITTTCMKRRNDTLNTASLHVDKKSKKDISNQTPLRDFFIQDIVFEQLIPGFKQSMVIDKNKKHTTSQALGIPYLPDEIKNAIRTCQFFYDKEWWYSAQNYTYKSTPYGVAFIDNNLAIGLKAKIIIINPSTGEALKDSFNTHDMIYCIAANNNYLAYGLNNGTVTCLDITTKKVILHCNSDSPSWSLAFDKDNQHLAIGRENNIVEIQSIKEQKIKTSYHNEKEIYGLSFFNNNELVAGKSSGIIYMFDQQTDERKVLRKASSILFALTYSSKNTNLAIGLKDGTVQIINQKTNNVILSTQFKQPIYSLAFDHTGEKLAIGIDDKSLNIVQRFHPTTDQLMFRNIISLFIQVKKQNKSINTVQFLLHSMATLFQLNKTEVTQIWKTFPRDMQSALWNKINRLIQKYGRDTSEIEMFALNNPCIKKMKYTGLDAHIVSPYLNPNINQLLLRKVIQLFFNTETIEQSINSPENLLNTIAYTYNLSNAELYLIWVSFPEEVQKELWNQFHHHIQQEINKNPGF